MMNRKQKNLLLIDGIVNLVLGILLLLSPLGVLQLLGLPQVPHYFYTMLLGAVIFGIGISLFIELLFEKQGFRGLGILGAITINICGGSALLIWLLINPLELALRGQIVLWTVCLIVLGVGIVELATNSWRSNE